MSLGDWEREQQIKRLRLAEQTARTLEAVARLRAATDGKAEAPERETACPVRVDVPAATITVDGEVYAEVEPHHCRMIAELVEARGEYRTGEQLTRLPACGGKNVRRELANLRRRLPALGRYLKASKGAGGGYRLVWKGCL